jgi:hypothetical protein
MIELRKYAMHPVKREINTLGMQRRKTGENIVV